ncbi:MAG: hypothetical protein AAFO69_01520, partial [Bacteroidota bacterium]
MRGYIKYCFIAGFTGLLLFSGNLSAQQQTSVYRSPVRAFCNKFSINLATGYGVTRYSHNLQGYNLIQLNDQLFITEDLGESLPDRVNGISNWLNNPVLTSGLDIRRAFDVPDPRLDNPVNNPLLSAARVFNGDSLDLRYVGIGHDVPINFSIHFNAFKFRIGAGIQFEKQWIRPLKPSVLEDEIIAYRPNFKTNTSFRYYGMIGYQFYEWWDLTFAGELQIGQISVGNNFNESLITRGLVTNIGVVIEDNWSEYFRVTLKPGIDIKNYTINLPEGPPIRHSHPAFYLQIGVSFTFPEIPRSPIPNDHIQLKHIITHPRTGKRMEVRGQPFWKKQNPKIGENHRKTLRNKGK